MYRAGLRSQQADNRFIKLKDAAAAQGLLDDQLPTVWAQPLSALLDLKESVSAIVSTPTPLSSMTSKPWFCGWRPPLITPPSSRFIEPAREILSSCSSGALCALASPIYAEAPKSTNLLTSAILH